MAIYPIAHINLVALQHNFACVKIFAPRAAILAMIKANAYGHGLVQVASALSAADALGVARLEEALLLRHHHISQAIVVMKGFLDENELRQMAQYNLVAVVHTPQQVTLLEKTHLVNPIRIWLKIDTGMHRLGFPPEQVSSVIERLTLCQNVEGPLQFMTHFARADELDTAVTHQQIAIFNQLISSAIPKSLAHSAAIMRYPDSHADWVRPGIMLYGISPFSASIGTDIGLQPVMTLSSQLIAVQQLRQGDAIGYGGTWVCPEEMPIGVVAIGYGDGYPRHAQNGTPVLVNGVICPLVGRVSMDFITVDLRPCPYAQPGDTVVLWGQGLAVERIAQCADTIAYELVCRVGRRVHYQFSDVSL